LRQLKLDKRTATAIKAGHPWLWPDVLDRSDWQPEPGEVVELLDAVGATMGCALAEGVQTPGVPALRVLSLRPETPPLRKLVFQRIAAASRLRERCLPADTSGYRLLNGEGDGLPGLVADRYGPVLVLKPDCRAWDVHLDLIVEALRSEAGRGLESMVLRSSDTDPRLLHGSQVPQSLVFSEAGRRYLVRPATGQKTGFFLDQRANRSHVQQLVCKGDNTLNLFSYSGGFSVAMALGGAERVHSVDLSESILADCRELFVLNGLDPKPHKFEATDIFHWLGDVGKVAAAQRYDLVVCDPPALSHRKSDLPNARQAYRRLHRGIAHLLKRNALLVTASCTARLDADELLEDVQAGLDSADRRVARVLRSAGAGVDHPVPPGFSQGRYLSCLTLVVE